jgi:hypothetical protein
MSAPPFGANFFLVKHFIAQNQKYHMAVNIVDAKREKERKMIHSLSIILQAFSACRFFDENVCWEITNAPQHRGVCYAVSINIDNLSAKLQVRMIDWPNCSLFPMPFCFVYNKM